MDQLRLALDQAESQFRSAQAQREILARYQMAEAEERRANAAIDVAKVIALFDDDPVAQAIVRGMMDGARGQELQDLSGLDKTGYESKRTKIRRRVEKLSL